MLYLAGCHDEPDPPDHNTGKLSIDFIHLYDQAPLEFDSVHFVNEAGNEIIFSELQYFISDVTLHYQDGSEYLIDAWKDIHYVDSDIPSTHRWNVYDSIPAGIVDSVTFTFGINEEKNQSFLFVNPPESYMFWPDVLGGGYHYLKLNGKWLTTNQQILPFNFHLGIGQIYDGEGNITGFVQNYFNICLKNISFGIGKDETTSIGIFMDVANWFRTPNSWDFNYWGGDIMQNQAAMHAACENGHDVFFMDIAIGLNP
jgi:hypothetical protein